MGGTRTRIGRMDDPIWREPPEPDRPRPPTSMTRTTAVVAAVIVLTATLAAWALSRPHRGVPACQAVTSRQLQVALRWTAGPPGSGEPERGAPHGTTECGYGPAGSEAARASVTVFAVPNGGAFYRQQAAVAASHRAIAGRDYAAFAVDTGFHADDPNQLQAFFLLKHGQYLNVLLTNFPPGSAEQLAPVVAAGLP